MPGLRKAFGLNVGTALWARVRVLAQGGGDYVAFPAAIADAANWDILLVCPGVYPFAFETLPANKCIEGLDRETCILRTTHNILDAAILSVGNQSALRNIRLESADAPAANRVSLISFAAAVPGEYVLLDNVHLARPVAGVQPFRINAPIYSQGGILDLFCDADRAIGIETAPSEMHDTIVNGVTNFYVFTFTAAAQTNYFVGCTFNSTTTTAWFRGTANANLGYRAIGCDFRGGAPIILSTHGRYDLTGCDLAAGAISVNVDCAVSMRGCTNYPAAITTTGAATFTSVDLTLGYNMVATPGTLLGWESFIGVDTVTIAAPSTLNLAAWAKSGIETLFIKDATGSAGANPITVDGFAGETLDGALTYIISDNYGWVILEKGETASAWHIVSSSAGPVSGMTVRIIAGGGVVAANDEYIEVTAAGTLTFPAAPGLGRSIYVKRNYVGANYTLDGFGMTFNGDATVVFSADGQSIHAVYNGALWDIS